MTCETGRRLMETNDPAFAAHALSCASCLIATHARYYEAPPGLEQRIRGRLDLERPAPSAWFRLAAAACLLLTASVVWNVVQFRSRVNREQLIAADVVSAHIRSLAGTHLLDVPSSDRHTVKPWFAGKLDFSPEVNDLEGFPLLGGRLEYFDGHPAAALVYGRQSHIINLFTWPSSAASSESWQTRNGYHLQQWSDGRMTFWAISDLNQSELAQFVSACRRR